MVTDNRPGAGRQGVGSGAGRRIHNFPRQAFIWAALLWKCSGFFDGFVKNCEVHWWRRCNKWSPGGGILPNKTWRTRGEGNGREGGRGEREAARPPSPWPSFYSFTPVMSELWLVLRLIKITKNCKMFRCLPNVVWEAETLRCRKLRGTNPERSLHTTVLDHTTVLSTLDFYIVSPVYVYIIIPACLYVQIYFFV